ncbi:hypothetical protein FO508_16910 [Bacillus pumilus]|uniref:Uncharacterized protein n=1 Tax=Bacillus pumilus TaxID=1408 RepID=A0AAE3WMM1_BACPU|nr:hypothetical protein [Bacillus pumilus]
MVGFIQLLLWLFYFLKKMYHVNIMLIIFNNLTILTKVIFFLFILWFFYNLFDFYKSELKQEKKKSN